MPLQDPVAVYNASSNFEAHMICNILKDAEIEAYPTDDVSLVGVCAFGLLPEIHKPQVWIDRSGVDRAKPILQEYDRQLLERHEVNGKRGGAEDVPVEAHCEECGRGSLFPVEDNGTVQECPHCGAYVDVGDTPDAEEWWNVGEPEDDAPKA
jgi:hypothetical protein